MAFRGPPGRAEDDEGLAAFRTEGREPGTRRKKIAGYLKAANELRQSYVQNWGSQYGNEEEESMPGAFPDSAIVRTDEGEMLIFPSYARRHVKTKPKVSPGTIQEVPGTGRDVRDTAGEGDAEFWRQQWEKYEDDKAIVDVDVRGWLFTPHKGQFTRKQRLMVALARQLVGIPAPSTAKPSPSASTPSSRSSSPQRRSRKHDEELAAQEAAAIMRKGNVEADIAGRGGFSEQPANDDDGDSPYTTMGRASSPRSREGSAAASLKRTGTSESLQSLGDEGIRPLQTRPSWTTPASMTPAELAVANSNLMTRLKPFMANPMANVPISAFFFNDTTSRQRTVTTDASGHFSFRAALDFVPTHVRILAAEQLSLQEEVHIVESRGVSLVSDIDDTVRHSAITRGAREIFRNAFIRDLGDLTIQGVKEWYTKLANMGVQVHYVSNSPWQLYPVITSFFALAGLPPGSFHLKQYSGMLQGIFEPVAERKKATLDKIMRDFPERRFILIGDSGEADLEVYTDVVMDHPNRVIGVFIRDVTTPPSKGFFDPSMGPLSGDQSPKKQPSRNKSTDSLSKARQLTRPSDIQDDEDDLRAAIAASLHDMEDQAARDRKAVFTDGPLPTRFEADGREPRRDLLPRRVTSPPANQGSVMKPLMGDLIDFSDDSGVNQAQAAIKQDSPATALLRTQLGQNAGLLTTGAARPAPPSKPPRLRSPSNANAHPQGPTHPPENKAAPPKPRKPSTSITPVSPSPLSQVQRSSPITTRAPNLPSRQSYRGAAKQKLASAYNAIPSASTYFGSQSTIAASGSHSMYSTNSDQGNTSSPRNMSIGSTEESKPNRSTDKRAPPPPPPRRNISSYPAAAAQYASNRLSGNWAGSDAGDTPGAQQPLNKKEEMWKRRWRRAKDILDREGVMLRTWRVGEDVMNECIDVVQGEIQGMKQLGGSEDKKQDRSSRR